MENNKISPHPIAASVGRRLKEAREKKSLTIEQIQKQTKIHSTVLIALEEGRASEILTDTYVRSFLKKYAQALGLPAGEILKECFPPHPEQAALNIPSKESHLPMDMRTAPRILYFTGIAVFGIAALLILIFVGGKIKTAFSKIKIVHNQKKMPGAVSAEKNLPKPVRSTQKTEVPAKTNSGSKQVISKSTPLNLVIKVREPVLVKLTRDGILIFARVLSKNLVETVTASKSIELEISKARALELTLNGRPVALPKKNNMVSLSITQKGIKIK